MESRTVMNAQEMRDELRVRLQNPATDPWARRDTLQECLKEALPACAVEVEAVAQSLLSDALYVITVSLTLGDGREIRVLHERTAGYLLHADRPVDHIAQTIAHRLGSELVREVDL